MSLENLIVDETELPPKPRRTLIYGVGGIGKSTFGAEAPNPIFVKTEDGLGMVKTKSYPLCKDFDTFMSYLTDIYSNDYKFETVCIDSLDWLEKLIWDVVAKKEGKSNIDEIGFYKGYNFAVPYWRRVIHALTMLWQKRMNIIVIAHERIEKIQNPDGEDYDRHSPAIHKFANEIIREWCDEVFYAHYVVYASKSDGDRKAKAHGNGERILQCNQSATIVAKSRLKMPDKIAFPEGASYKEYAKYFKEVK